MYSIKRILVFLIIINLFTSVRNKELTWVAIGDSITYLNDHAAETGNRVTKGYLTGVAEQLPGLHYINKGFNGWTSGNIAARIDSLGLVKADIYSVFLGTNDWWQGRPVGSLEDYTADKGNTTVYGSFRIIIDKIRKLNPDATILLITPMQRADFVYINDSKNNAYGSYKPKNGQYLEAFADAINAIGNYEKIPVIDLYHNDSLKVEDMVHFKRLKDPQSGSYVNYKYPESATIPFNPLTDEYPYPEESIKLTYDGLHPSDAGNAIIAKAIVQQLKQVDLPVSDKPAVHIADTIQADWTKYINLDIYNQPFWKSDTITDETIQVVRENGHASAKLLFKAKKILSVRAANRTYQFTRGKDWDYKNGVLTFGSKSSVPFFNKEELVFKQQKPGRSMEGKIKGTHVLFSEGDYFSSRQLAVTYIKDRAVKWQGPVPVFAAEKLPNTIALLNNKQKLHIVFYGNSIEAGYNASGHEKVPPYMPAWPELIVYNLRHRYGANISFTNKSVAGRLAGWGRDSVMSKVVPENPDLVIIGFGMNDGTLKVPPEIFREQIKGIIDSVQQKKPSAEFILIAPMLANPLTNFDGLQKLYKKELDKLTGKGVVVADMTAVHTALLKHKTYQDMTGNNINHPNDYLARWYAQIICGLLMK